MVSRRRKVARNGMSRATRKRHAALKRAKTEAEQKRDARRRRVVNAIKLVGTRFAAAFLMCGALAVCVNSNDNRSDFSGKKKTEDAAAKAPPEEERAEGSFGSGTHVFLPLQEEMAKVTLTSNDYAEGWAGRGNPWANAKPAPDGFGRTSLDGLGEGSRDSSTEGRRTNQEGGKGKPKKGGGKKSPERKREQPWRIDWDHLDMLPPRRERVSLDSLDPEDEKDGSKKEKG